MRKHPKTLHVNIHEDNGDSWFVADETIEDLILDDDEMVIGVYELKEIIDAKRTVVTKSRKKGA